MCESMGQPPFFDVYGVEDMTGMMYLSGRKTVLVRMLACWLRRGQTDG